MTTPILLPLDKVKELLGLTDTASDAALTAALPVVTAMFENYCKRGLAYVADVVEEQSIVAVERLPLFRYPVEVVSELLINGVAQAPAPVAPQVDSAHGFIYIGACGWWGRYPGYAGWGYPGNFARVTYSGGYDPDEVPADLADAFARCCADYGGVTYSSGGAASSGAGAPLKSLGLGSGALTVSFDTTQAAKSSYDTSSVPPILAPYLYTIDAYRVKDYC